MGLHILMTDWIGALSMVTEGRHGHGQTVKLKDDFLFCEMDLPNLCQLREARRAAKPNIVATV